MFLFRLVCLVHRFYLYSPVTASLYRFACIGSHRRCRFMEIKTKHCWPRKHRLHTSRSTNASSLAWCIFRQLWHTIYWIRTFPYGLILYWMTYCRFGSKIKASRICVHTMPVAVVLQSFQSVRHCLSSNDSTSMRNCHYIVLFMTDSLVRQMYPRYSE